MFGTRGTVRGELLEGGTTKNTLSENPGVPSPSFTFNLSFSIKHRRVLPENFLNTYTSILTFEHMHFYTYTRSLHFYTYNGTEVSK